MADKNLWVTAATISMLIVIAVAPMYGIARILNIIPPGHGTVVEIGHHPAFFPKAFCNEERYYIVIENTNGTQSWTWYVDEWYWKRWKVGDKVGVGIW